MKIDISSFFEYWTELANNNVFLTILIALLLPILEAILPFLPLVFIVNYNIVMFNAVFSFAGNWILALLVSALGAIIGAVLIFFLLKYSLGKWFRKKVEKNEKVVKAMEWINKVNTSYLIIIMSNPYTPTSIFNYAMALSGFATKKY
ncbi:MAG: VTT domain-containing protein, partial [Bacilli bacterium]